MERVSLAEVIGRRVTWDSRKSRPQRGEHWACCPFHQEKTPSFKVDDHKGVYYCFGCHETGNAITFIRKTENLDYRETLHRLAEMAGMEIPKSEWDQTREESTHKPLYDVCEQACTQFQIALSSHAGKAARVYLEERGLNAQAIEQFEIGFAGQRNPGLMQILRKTGVSQEHLLTAGLCVEPDGGGQPYDRFRNRIMFPIRDLRGRLIGFGGRALDPAAPAKYLNSPETPIFKKGACLYNAVAARNALGKEESDLVVVEGYMDVIALSSYGIRACVAPLGTAITENQLRLLWKLAPEPVLALDGDSAGLRAAERVSDLALPLLEPGKSLKFSFLPTDTDPDDYVRQHGTSAMRDLLNRALPLADFLWQTEVKKQSIDTPERMAAFEARLRKMIASIQDTTVRRRYNQVIGNRLFEINRGSVQSGNRKQGSVQPTRELQASILMTGNHQQEIGVYVRESVILGICLTVPPVLEAFPERLENLALSDQTHRQLLDCMIDAARNTDHDRASFQSFVRERCGTKIVDRLLDANRLLPLHVAAESDETGKNTNLIARAKTMLSEELAKIETNSAKQYELEEAILDTKERTGGDPTRRLGEAVRAQQEAQRGDQSMEAMGLVQMENGVAVDPRDLAEFKRLVGDSGEE